MEKIGLQGVMDLTDFNSGINKYNSEVDKATGNTEKKAGLMSRAFKGVGDIVKTGLGTALGFLTAQAIPKVIDGMKNAIQAGSDLNESLNATSVVFGHAAVLVQNFGETAARTAGLSASDFNQMAAQMGALLTNFGLDVNEAARATIGLTQRAADMASIFNTDVSDAFLAVQAGLRGETEPLRRFGVDVSDAAVKAYALANGMIKAGQEMDNNTKITARMALIYEQTDKIAGDFVNTSDGLANSARIQEAEWQNFLATMGMRLLPIVQAVKLELMKMAEQVMPVVLDALEALIKVGGEVWDFLNVNFVPILKDVWSWLKTNIPEAIAESSKWFSDNLLPVLTTIKNYIVDNVLPRLSDVVSWLGTNIPDAIASVKQWVNETLLPAWQGLTTYVNENFVPALQGVANEVGRQTPIAIEQSKTAWNDLRTKALIPYWEWTQGPLSNSFVNIAAWLQVKTPAAIRIGNAAWDDLKRRLGIIKELAVDPLTEGIQYLLDKFNTNNTEKIQAFLNGVGKGFLLWAQSAKDLVEGIVNALANLAKKLTSGIEIPDWLKDLGDLLGIGGQGFLAARAQNNLALLGKVPGGTSALTAFAGSILSRFQSKFTTPLEDKVGGLRDTIEELDKWLAENEPSFGNVEYGAKLQERAKAEEDLKKTTEELTIQKERELALQKQLNDLSFLQAQLEFVSFLKENKLDVQKILGDLKLGLNLDLPAFMDAITRALGTIVGGLDATASSANAGGGLSLGTNFMRNSNGSATAGTPSNVININVNASINNGMDLAEFDNHILQLVAGAIA